MQKGIAYSSVAIVSLLGILLLSFWSISQLSTTFQFGATYTERSKNDMAISRLEVAKKFLAQDLIQASQEASLDVAANGGTVNSKTFWYCNNNPTAPSLKEFNYALSTYTGSYMNSYIDSVKDSEISQMGIKVSHYDCYGTDNPGQQNCLQEDSSNCEYFTSQALNGLIEVTDPAYASYSGDLSSDITSNRLFFLYYKLKDNTDNNLFVRTIMAAYQDECTNPISTEAKLEAAIKEACKTLEFDQYIKCSYEILCMNTANPISCLNIPCDRAPITQQLCYQSTQSASGDNSANIVGKSVKAQGLLAGIQLKITLTDTKFNLQTAKGLKPLVFNMWQVLSLAEAECTPINSKSV